MQQCLAVAHCMAEAQPSAGVEPHIPFVPVRVTMPALEVQHHTEPGSRSYSHEEYWSKRYKEKNTTFDWFFSYNALSKILNSCLNKELPLMHVGCGNSTLQDGMTKDGFQSIVNVDISPVVINQMRLHHQSEGNSYEVVDCRDMRPHGDGSFAGVLDKGTLDAVLCCKGGHADAVKYTKEVVRILAPDGIFLLISLGMPKARAKLLELGGIQVKDVEVMLLPKPQGFYQTESKLQGRCASRDPDTRAGKDSRDTPVHMQGPFSVSEAAALLGEEAGSQTPSKLDPHDYFFAYICRKREARREPGEEQSGQL